MARTPFKTISGRPILSDVSELTSYSDSLNKIMVPDGSTFVYDPTSSATVDGIGVLAATGKGPGRWINKPSESLMAWRYPTLQAAINAAQALKCPLRLRPYETITLPAEGIQVDLTRLKMIGFASTLHFPFDTGSAVHTTGPADNSFLPYTQNWCGMSDIKITTPTNPENTCVAIDMNASAEPGPSHVHLDKINIQGFEDGILIRNNAYLINITRFEAQGCGTGIHVAPGTNAGERIFIDGNIYNSRTAIWVENPNADVHIGSMSGDFNNQDIVCDQGSVFFTNLHLEGQNYSSPIITVSANNGAQVQGVNLVLLSQSNTTKPNYLIQNNAPAGKGGGFRCKNISMHNIQTTSGYLIGGDGDSEVDVPLGYEITDSVLFASTKHTLLQDGFFASNTIIDDWVAIGTDYRQSRLAMRNCTLSLSTDRLMAGTSHSLKVTKDFGNPSTCQVQIILPCSAMNPLAYRFYLDKPGSQTGVIYASFGYGSGYYIGDDELPALAKATSISSQAITLTSSATVFQPVVSGQPLMRMPKDATHVYLSLNLDGFSGPGSIYLSSVHIADWKGVGAKPGFAVSYDNTRRRRDLSYILSSSTTDFNTYKPAASVAIQVYNDGVWPNGIHAPSQLATSGTLEIVVTRNTIVQRYTDALGRVGIRMTNGFAGSGMADTSVDSWSDWQYVLSAPMAFKVKPNMVPSNGDKLVWNAAQGWWENSSVS